MRSSASWLAAAAQSRGSVHDRRMAWLGSVPAAAPSASFGVVAAARTAPATSSHSSGQHSLLHGERTMALKAAVKRKVPKSCIPAAPSKRRRCEASEPGTSEGDHVTCRQKDGKKPATKEQPDQPDHVSPASILSLISNVIGVDGLKFQGFMTCPNGTPGCTMTTLKIL
ncbi:hypothetical protein ACP70R_012081 [Stipagrostis hirtigluma subsp. patula]